MVELQVSADGLHKLSRAADSFFLLEPQKLAAVDRLASGFMCTAVLTCAFRLILCAQVLICRLSRSCIHMHTYVYIHKKRREIIRECIRLAKEVDALLDEAASFIRELLVYVDELLVYVCELFVYVDELLVYVCELFVYVDEHFVYVRELFVHVCAHVRGKMYVCACACA
jgi:hypothetical protein